MTILNQNTKRAKHFIDSYFASKYYDIRECYEHYSCKKFIAQLECKEKCAKEAGIHFKIISFNSMQFTCGWLTADGLRVETRDSSYLIKDILPF